MKGYIVAFKALGQFNITEAIFLDEESAKDNVHEILLNFNTHAKIYELPILGNLDMHELAKSIKKADEKC